MRGFVSAVALATQLTLSENGTTQRPPGDVSTRRLRCKQMAEWVDHIQSDRSAGLMAPHAPRGRDH